MNHLALIAPFLNLIKKIQSDDEMFRSRQKNFDCVKSMKIRQGNAKTIG